MLYYIAILQSHWVTPSLSIHFFPYSVPAVFAATLSPQPSPHNTHNSDTTEYLKLYKPLVSWIWQEGWVCCPYTKSSGEIPTPLPNLHMEPTYLSNSSSSCLLAYMLELLEPSCNKAGTSAFQGRTVNLLPQEFASTSFCDWHRTLWYTHLEAAASLKPCLHLTQIPQIWASLIPWPWLFTCCFL